jgi:two-component system, NarL family, nitrate/nitrite response regulator NarL
LPRIALIDDHAFLRKGVGAALRSVGHEIVVSTGNADTALDEIAKADPDVVVLDQRMGPTDGASILAKMRAGGDQRPVVFLVNEISDAALLSIMKSKVDGIVFKDCPEDRLFEAIDAVVAGKRFIDGDLIDKTIALSAVPEPAHATARLTERERSVAALVCKGLKNREIGDQLGMTEGTVKIYLHNVYRKLGVANRTSLAMSLSDTLKS